jgi:hypothetical protein
MMPRTPSSSPRLCWQVPDSYNIAGRRANHWWKSPPAEHETAGQRLDTTPNLREPNTMSWYDVFSNEDTLALMIPIVAILVGGIIAIAAMIIKHRERIAMIEQGVHPDYPQDEGGPG